jgi:hypothetical protein
MPVEVSGIRSSWRRIIQDIDATEVNGQVTRGKALFKISQTQSCQKVAVHLQKVLEVMSTSVYTGLKLFNFIRKHFLQICL